MAKCIAILRYLFVEDRIMKCFPKHKNNKFVLALAIIMRVATIIILNNIMAFVGIFHDNETIYSKLLPTLLSQLILKVIDDMGATQSALEAKEERAEQQLLLEQSRKDQTRQQRKLEEAKEERSFMRQLLLNQQQYLQDAREDRRAILRLLHNPETNLDGIKHEILNIITTDEWPPLPDDARPAPHNPATDAIYDAAWDDARWTRYGSM